MTSLAELIPRTDVLVGAGLRLRFRVVDTSRLAAEGRIYMEVSTDGKGPTWGMWFQGTPEDAIMDADDVGREALATTVAVNVAEWLETRANPCIVDVAEI